MKLTEKQLTKHFGHLEDHQYKHNSEALGMHIYSKEHFIYEMERQNMVPVDVGEELADGWASRNKQKEYSGLSPKALKIFNFLKHNAKDGMIKLSEYPKAVKALEDLGMSFSSQEHIGNQH